jgi:PBP1b-binding outer membrane lipoprotein LpoB
MKQEGVTMGRNAKGLEKGIKAAILFCGFFFLGCNIQKLAIVMTAEATGNAAKEVQKYDLPFIVGAGIPSNLLILETGRILDPNNVVILSNLAETYCSYGSGFVEDYDPEKANILYYKGYKYAEQALSIMNKNFKTTLEKMSKGEATAEDLAKTIEKKNVREAFWYTACLGYWISTAKGSPESVIEISKMLAMVDRLIELDEDHFYSSPLLLRATFYATAPSILGGSPIKAKIYFDRVFKKTGGKFLLAKAVYAQFYATLLKDRTEKEVYQEEIERLKEKIKSYEEIISQTEDKEIKDKLNNQLESFKKELKEIENENVAKLFSEKTGEQIFDETIEEILTTPVDILPDVTLVNAVAKEKAKILKQRRSQYF